MYHMVEMLLIFRHHFYIIICNFAYYLEIFYVFFVFKFIVDFYLFQQ